MTVASGVAERALEDPAVDAMLDRVLQRLAPLHTRLCPRQVLGARIGLYGGDLLGLHLPRLDKRLLTIVETDGCFVDGVIEATGCRIGRRTLRVVDHGKVAAVFVDAETGWAVRVRPRPEARRLAWLYAPSEPDPWHAQLEGYQRMPVSELLEAKAVELLTPIHVLVGRAGVRVACTGCGEEVMNGREVCLNGRTLCVDCAGFGYLTRPAPSRAPEPVPVFRS